MQRDHNFTSATQLNSSLCLQTRGANAAHTGAFPFLHALKATANGLLRHVNTIIATPAAAQQVRLAPHQLWNARVDADTSIICRTGVLWITLSGDTQDYMLRAGQTLNICGSANVVISAFSQASEFSVQKA